MGKIHVGKCNKCGYEINVKIGQGRLFYKDDYVIKLFTETQSDEVQAAMRDSLWQCEYVLGTCDKCKEIVSVPRLRSGEVTITGRCDCGEPVEVIENENVENDISCPKCKETVHLIVEGIWD